MIIFYILAIYAISFIVRNISGPFDILSKIRNYLLASRAGVFFYELLNCPWCVGFHCGYIVYFLACLSFSTFSLPMMVIWAFAGSAIVAGGDMLYNAIESAIIV